MKRRSFFGLASLLAVAAPASAKGGAVTIINQTSGRIGAVLAQRLSNGDRALILREVGDSVAAALRDPNSRVSKGMRKAF